MQDTERAGTGVGKVDEILGSLRIGDNVIWHDDSGSLAGEFCQKFMEASFADGKPIVYVSFDRSPNNLLKKLGTLADAPGLVVLDCFTRGKGGGDPLFLKYYNRPEKSSKVRLVENPQDPSSMGEADRKSVV